MPASHDNLTHEGRKRDDAMRLWADSEGTLLIDEQVIRTIASFGSVSKTAEHGDITLISSSDGNTLERPSPTQPKSRKLTDYLN